MVYEESLNPHGTDSVNVNADNNYGSYMQSNWEQIAETTMPLKASKIAGANNHYRQFDNDSSRSFQASVQQRSKEISRKLILVNLISLVVNLLLALAGFYLSFVNNSPATTAFAADCILDFISSAIVLWRYYGDLQSVYMQAREQIACIYLGALFEISALAIIVKSSSDMASSASADAEPEAIGYDIVYLASVATVACTVLVVFKCALYRTIRDNSILLDVINTVISTVFAVSIIMSQALINVNPSFWYLDPILSIVLALFMAAFGIKVIHQNFNILRPVYRSTGGCNNYPGHQDSAEFADADKSTPSALLNNLWKDRALAPATRQPPIDYSKTWGAKQQQLAASYGAHRTPFASVCDADKRRLNQSWAKADYSTILFV